MDDNWRVQVLTWNVASLPPTESLDLSNLFDDTSPDMIAVGLQEVSYTPGNYMFDVTFREEPWTLLFRNFLAKRDYVQLSCSWTTRPRLMGVVLLLFVKRAHLLYIQRLEAKFCKTGFSGFSSHKGAVSIRVTLSDGSHFTFICSHQAANNEALSYRIKEYHMVLNSVRFDQNNIVSDDYVFWLGDLNFRVEGFPADEAIKLVNLNYIEKLLEWDQLKRCVESGRAFNHFHEAPITFKPTYKYLIGTSTLDPRRSPSWCDRILWRVEASHRSTERQLSCQCIEYTSKSEYTFSDHKPVRAAFNVKMYSMAAGRLIEFRDLTFPWLDNQNNLCHYFVSNQYQPAASDWIGIFKLGFKTDSETVTWAYTMTSWEVKKLDDGVLMNLTFKQRNLPPQGRYRLGYFSRDKCCLLALSEPFEISSPKCDNAHEAT